MKTSLGVMGLVVVAAWLASPRLDAAPQLPKGRKIEKGENDYVGAVWEYSARESMKKTAKEVESGRFRATRDGRLYGPKGKPIGTYAYTNKVRDTVRLKIDEGKLKGTIDLTKQTINPPRWQGSWKMSDGTQAHMVIQMLKD